MLSVEKGEVTPKGAGKVADEDDELRIYIVIRRDVGDEMSKAKFGIQCAHAALTTFYLCQKRDRERADRYMRVAQTKIVLEVPDEASLRELHEKARKAGYDAALITDAGRTEFAGPTTTGIAIGPVWWKKEARKLIGSLPRYKDE